MDDAELLARSRRTLAASWAALARASDASARVEHRDGAVVGVFPVGPDRDVFNNALLGPGGEGIEASVQAYAEAGIEDFALWVHEHDDAGREALADAGCAATESTRAMALDLSSLDAERPDDRLPSPLDGAVLVAINGLPEGHLPGLEETPELRIVLDPEGRAGLLTVDCDGDCGVYLVATRPDARRQGLAAALAAQALRAARDRGCSTASLQSSPMAERLYARLGFRDLGRILEHAPG